MHVRARPIRRWLLILAVVAGLVGMHHLVDGHLGADVGIAVSSTAGLVDPAVGAAMMMDPGMTMDPGMAMAMHMCLAVLVAWVTFVLALGVLATIGRRRDLTRRLSGIVVARRPPRRSAVRLAELCVLRN